jgi:hypothetical protein
MLKEILSRRPVEVQLGSHSRELQKDRAQEGKSDFGHVPKELCQVVLLLVTSDYSHEQLPDPNVLYPLRKRQRLFTTPEPPGRFTGSCPSLEGL